LVFALYAGSQLDVFSLELTPGGRVPEEASVLSLPAKSPAQQPTQPPLVPLATVTASPSPIATATAAAEATPTATPDDADVGSEEESDEETDLLALADEEEEEPEPTPEPEPTKTPEPEPSPTPTLVAPTATPPPAATPTAAVAHGVLVTPVGGSAGNSAAATLAAPATPAKAAPATPAPASFTGSFSGFATPYWDGLAGNYQSCGAVFDPADTTVLAVSYAYTQSIPCGTALKVCGTAGCIDVVRSDLCPGCEANHIDLSRAGFTAVCGAVSNCNVTVTKR